MKCCFVICPLGKADSIQRERAQKFKERIVDPVLEASGYVVRRADLTTDHLSIPDSISKQIFDSDLVVADLTDSNANVFYELGKRHAWGLPCVHFTQDIDKLPFDVSSLRAIEYDLDDPERLEFARKELRIQAQALERTKPHPPFELSAQRLVDLTGATVLAEVLQGQREHYGLAQKIIQLPCKRLFLMQRSSSLILGPEYEWDEEALFYDVLLEKIAQGTEFLHVVSLEGIARHLDRPQSHFPNLKSALAKLSRRDAAVGVRGPELTYYFKRVPDEADESDLKPDRQARTMLLELEDGEVEGVVVVDLGGQQSCFRLRGPKMRTFFESCRDFYYRCPPLKWAELEPILTKHSAELLPATRSDAGAA